METAIAVTTELISPDNNFGKYLRSRFEIKQMKICFQNKLKTIV
jgi:hypothetical protein